MGCCMRWYHRPMTTTNVQACANIAFIKYRLTKLDWTHRKAYFAGKFVSSGRAFFSGSLTKSWAGIDLANTIE